MEFANKNNLPYKASDLECFRCLSMGNKAVEVISLKTEIEMVHKMKNGYVKETVTKLVTPNKVVNLGEHILKNHKVNLKVFFFFGFFLIKVY